MGTRVTRPIRTRRCGSRRTERRDLATVAKCGCVAVDVDQNEAVSFVDRELRQTQCSHGEPGGLVHTRHCTHLPVMIEGPKEIGALQRWR